MRCRGELKPVSFDRLISTLTDSMNETIPRAIVLEVSRISMALITLLLPYGCSW